MTPNPPKRGTKPAAVNPFGTSAANLPRARLIVGGVVHAIHSARVVNNNYFACDTWSAVVALGPDKDHGVDYWSSEDLFEAEILLGFAGPDGAVAWKSFVQGKVSRITIDDAQGTVSLDGRDYAADLLETQIIDSYHNLTASDVAKMFAAEHGLTADVDPTTKKIGSYYEHSTTGVSTGEMSHASNQWDLLCWLAQQEDGYAVYVRGKTLYFKKYEEDDRVPFNIDYKRGEVTASNGGYARSSPTLNAISILGDRDMTRAKDIEVVVRCWSGNHARQFEVVASRAHSSERREHRERGSKAVDAALEGVDMGSTGRGRGRGRAVDPALAGVDMGSTSGPAQHNDKAPPRQKGIHRYIYEVTGMTHASALAFAQAKLREATLHERRVTIVLPGELEMDPRRKIAVSGHSKGFDQDYYVDEITREVSIAGFKQTVVAKNESPGGVTKTVVSG